MTIPKASHSVRASVLRRATLNVVVAIAWCVPMLSASPVSATEQRGGTEPSATNGGTDSTRSTKVAVCVEAHSSGQELRQGGQLLESRARLIQCAQGTCPELVRAECLSMLDELRTQVPSVIFRISVDGAPCSDVEVVMDGRTLFSEVPTRAFDIDPGKHHFEFRHGQFMPVNREVMITEGDKLVPITVQFAPPVTAQEESAPKVATAPIAERRPVPVPVYLLSGVGVMGLGGFIGFGLATHSKENTLKSTCSPACSQSEIDSVHSRAVTADISLGIGVAAFAAAATYYLLRPSESVQAGVAILPSGRLQSQLRVEF